MKVRDLVKKYQMSSNATVKLNVVTSGSEAALRNEDLREIEPEWAMKMTVQTFSGVDNVLTIYAK